MTLDEIEQLISRSIASGFVEVEYSTGRARLRIVRSAGSVAATAKASADCDATRHIRAPAAGIFMSTHPMQLPRDVSSANVEVGDVVGLMKIGPCLCAVLATHAGRLMQLIDDETLVGYGEPLYLVS